jgi:hypothetical protein
MTVSMIDVALAQPWRPAPGDELRGFVAHREIRTTEFGTYPVIFISPEGVDDRPGSLVAVHAFHTTLRDGFKALAPQRGTLVSITYAGEKESNSRKDSKGEPVSYHHYVVVDPDADLDAGELDWDSPDF